MKIGTRVIGVGSFENVTIDGQHGIIINQEYIDGSVRYKVLFDKRFDKLLHSKWMRCWIVKPENLIKEESEVFPQEEFNIEKALFELLV